MSITFDEGWEVVQKGIDKLKNILEGHPESPFSSEDYMTTYATVYNMCTQKPPHDYSQKLYDRYGEVIAEYLTSIVLPSLKSKHDEFLLKEFARRWENHKVFVRWLTRFFHYLNRYFITRRNLTPLTELGIPYFKNMVYQEVKSNVTDAVIALINQDRNGAHVDKSLLKNVLDVVVEIGNGANLYGKDFEAYLLEDAGYYYARKAASWIGEEWHQVEDMCRDYLSKAEESMKKERKRISQFLYSSSVIKLIERVQHELFLAYSNQLLEMELSCWRVLLRDNKVEDLSRMFRHHKIVRFLEPVADIFKEHIIAEGTGLVSQWDDAACYKASNAISGMQQGLVRQIIELHDKYKAYIANCFSNHFLFQKALSEGFRKLFNWGPSRISSGELLAIYCDNVLKKGGCEKLSDEAKENELEKTVELVAYVWDRDLFAEFYRRRLFRRLLIDRNADEDNEKFVLSKFKQRYGGFFTSKMEAMVTDLQLSRDIKAKFERYLSYNQAVNPGIDLAVSVLTTGSWPSIRSSTLKLPHVMLKSMEAFKEFFQTQRKNQKLTWIYSLGSCSIIGNFEPQPIEMIVSTYQAAVLVLFNDSDRLGYDDIKTQLNLTEYDSDRVLHSLSCAKYNVLNKYPPTKIISPTDEFEFNAEFTDRMRRIKIPLPTIEERRRIIQDVERDRRYAIDASIVRIMKMRKILAHQQLVAECIDQLSHTFKPDVRTIKKQIEDLIFREYLERDKANASMVKYLA